MAQVDGRMHGRTGALLLCAAIRIPSTSACEDMEQSSGRVAAGALKPSHFIGQSGVIWES